LFQSGEISKSTIRVRFLLTLMSVSAHVTHVNATVGTKETGTQLYVVMTRALVLFGEGRL